MNNEKSITDINNFHAWTTTSYVCPNLEKVGEVVNKVGDKISLKEFQHDQVLEFE